MENIAKRIEKLCKDNTLKKSELARFLGVGEQAVYSWCAGRRQMDRKNYERFCYLEKVSGSNNIEMSSTIESVCDEITFLNDQNSSKVWASKLLSTFALSLRNDEKPPMGSDLTKSLTDYIKSFDIKDVLSLIGNLSLSVNNELKEESLEDNEFIDLFKDKWSGTNLSLEYMEKKGIINLNYSYGFSKKEIEKTKKKLEEIAESPEFSDILKTRKHLGATLFDLSDKELARQICQLYSFQTCFIPNKTYSLSKGAKLSKSIFEDRWSLDIRKTKDWKEALRIIDNNLSRTDSLRGSLFKEVHIYKTLISFNSVYE